MNTKTPGNDFPLGKQFHCFAGEDFFSSASFNPIEDADEKQPARRPAQR
jgi:hypothetical protein